MGNNKLEMKNGKKSKLGRNDLCHCGSNKKYKNCCLKKDQEEERLNNLLNQSETVSDKYFTVREYIELSGYPVVGFDFFLLEILNITGTSLYRYNKVNKDEIKKVILELYSYSKDFYGKCLKCEYNCLEQPLKEVDFETFLGGEFDKSHIPVALQEEISINVFYIEFINGFVSRLQQELSKIKDEQTSYEMASLIYWSLIEYVASNCSEQCNNECLIEHKKNAYCDFCTFGSNKLSCPKKDEIPYDIIKASEADMKH